MGWRFATRSGTRSMRKAAPSGRATAPAGSLLAGGRAGLRQQRGRTAKPIAGFRGEAGREPWRRRPGLLGLPGTRGAARAPAAVLRTVRALGGGHCDAGRLSLAGAGGLAGIVRFRADGASCRHEVHAIHAAPGDAGAQGDAVKWPWSKPVGGMTEVENWWPRPLPHEMRKTVARCPRQYRWRVVLRGGAVADLCDECATRLGDKFETMTQRKPPLPPISPSAWAWNSWAEHSRCQAAADDSRPGDCVPVRSKP